MYGITVCSIFVSKQFNTEQNMFWQRQRDNTSIQGHVNSVLFSLSYSN